MVVPVALIDGGFSVNGLEVNDFSSIWLEDFDPGVDEVEVSDINSSVYDETYMGVDFYRGPAWTFTVIVEGSTQQEVLDRVGRVKAAWRDTSASKRGGETTELKFRQGGRERVAYGRTRRFACNPSRTSLEGWARVELEFKLSDPLVYQSGWEMHELILPAAADESTFPSRLGSIPLVGGDAPTPFIVDVFTQDAKVVNPAFIMDGRRYEFETTIPRGSWLRVDSRRGFARLGGGSVNGRNVIGTMKDRTRLRQVRIPPQGEVEIMAGGSDTSGTARFEYWWRPAYYSF